jgi:hypothetical protein
MPHVKAWVKDIVEDVLGGAPFKIGDAVRHPDGRRVKIIGGTYWGEFGLSNFWEWREVLPNNKFGPVESGYGWRSP